MLLRTGVFLWKETCNLLCHHPAIKKVRTGKINTVFSRFWSQLTGRVLFWRAAASACAWGGVIAEMRNEDSGDMRTIFGLLQSWGDLRPPQRWTHWCYLLEGLSKHITVTSKRFVFSVPVCWLKPKLPHLCCCCCHHKPTWAKVAYGTSQPQLHLAGQPYLCSASPAEILSCGNVQYLAQEGADPRVKYCKW